MQGISGLATKPLSTRQSRLKVAGARAADRHDDGAPASGSEFSLLPPENSTGNFTKITQRFPVRIRLAAAEERLEERPCWHLTLSDNGCGIPQEALAKVFDPFFSIFGGGTGLGLAVSHRIIVAHGGLLFIESQLGRGTTVHLRLAAAESA